MSSHRNQRLVPPNDRVAGRLDRPFRIRLRLAKTGQGARTPTHITGLLALLAHNSNVSRMPGGISAGYPERSDAWH